MSGWEGQFPDSAEFADVVNELRSRFRPGDLSLLPKLGEVWKLPAPETRKIESYQLPDGWDPSVIKEYFGPKTPT